MLHNSQESFKKSNKLQSSVSKPLDSNSPISLKIRVIIIIFFSSLESPTAPSLTSYSLSSSFSTTQEFLAIPGICEENILITVFAMTISSACKSFSYKTSHTIPFSCISRMFIQLNLQTRYGVPAHSRLL